MEKPKAKHIITVIVLLAIAAGLLVSTGLQKCRNAPEDVFAVDEIADVQADEGFMKSRVNILLIGWDQSPERDDVGSEYYRGENDGFRSDVLMLLSVDFDGNKAQLISVPRDTMTKIYCAKGFYKINAAFANGGGSMENGFEYAMKTAENLMSISVDYYAALNMTGLKMLVDAMGGVDYNVEQEITINGRTLKSGQQCLDGQQVLDYCRARKGYGTDVDRTDRQQKILFAMFTQLRETGKLLQLPKLYLAMKDHIHTNLNAEKIAALALFANGLDMEKDITRYTLEGKYINDVPQSGAAFYCLDVVELKWLVKEVFGRDMELDCSIDYRSVEWAKSAEKGMEYVNGAEYLGTFGGEAFYSTDLYDYIDEAACELETACAVTDVLPHDEQGLLRVEQDTQLIKEKTYILEEMLLQYCEEYGITQTDVNFSCIPQRLLAKMK